MSTLLPSLLVALVGSVLSFAVFHEVRKGDEVRVRSDLSLRAEWRARDLERKISLATDSLKALALFMSSQKSMDAASFHRFARLLHDAEDSHSELDWAPWVRGDERAAFVAAARQAVAPDYDITDMTADGRAVPAATRDAYMPTLFQETFNERPGPLGRDGFRRPEIHAAALAARDEGKPFAFPPLPLMFGTERRLGFSVLWPVYATGTVPETLAERQAAFLGLVISRYRLDRLLTAAIAGTPRIDEAIDISIDAGGGATPIKVAHFDPESGHFLFDAAPDQPTAADIVLTREFDVLGRHWALTSSFSPAVVASLRSGDTWVWLILGLALTGLATAFTYREQMRRSVVEAAVEDRTAALTQEVGLRREQESAAQAMAQQLSQSEARYRQLIDKLPNGVIIHVEGKVVFANPAAASLLRAKSMDQLIGMPALDILHPDDRAAAMQNIRAALQGAPTGPPVERRMLRFDGSVGVAELDAIPLQVGDKPGLMIVAADVTSRKAAEVARLEIEAQLRQSQKMEAIGNLTGGMAHDFNNLLAVIIGNLDIIAPLADRLGDARGRIDDAIEAALRGADLTRRLLAFARRQPLQPRAVAVNELLTGAVKLLSRTIGADIEISLDLADNTWPVVADPTQIESALMNLATNARDAMPNGGRLIIATANAHLDADYVATHADVAPGDYVVIAVSDTGSGMSAEIMSHIFEPFFTTKEVDKGSGLGLSMVFGFMKQSGGHVNVYSEPGAGTTFRLYLPRAAAVSAGLQQPAVPAAAAAKGETVLAVEDNEDLLRVLLLQLKSLGYRALQAKDAAAALALLEQEKVDLLLTDIVMPGGMDGYALASDALARWPALKVVLTSGFPEARVGDRLGAVASAARLLSKPYRREDLARALREALDAS